MHQPEKKYGNMFMLIMAVLVFTVYPRGLSTPCYGNDENSVDYSGENSPNRTIGDISPPSGYTRSGYTKNTFPWWLRNLPLKQGLEIIGFDNLSITGHSFSLCAVLAKPLLFSTDIEECADFCMRLWAEYHLETGKQGELYLFTFKGERKYFRDCGMDFISFLRTSMSYTNPHSLLLGSRPVEGNPEPGHFIIQADDPYKGHTSLILDACVNPRGAILYLIGFGYMPAQEFHIEKAPPGYGIGGWFSLEGYMKYLGDFYCQFGQARVRRF